MQPAECRLTHFSNEVHISSWVWDHLHWNIHTVSGKKFFLDYTSAEAWIFSLAGCLSLQQQRTELRLVRLIIIVLNISIAIRN